MRWSGRWCCATAMKLLRRICQRRFASIAARRARAELRKRRGTNRFWVKRIFARPSGSLRLFICGGNWKSIIGMCRRRRPRWGFIGRVCRRNFANWGFRGRGNRGGRGFRGGKGCRGGEGGRGDGALVAGFGVAGWGKRQWLVPSG